MSIMAAVAQGGRTVLFGNLDVIGARWKRGGGANDWTVENGAQDALPVALNDAGLAQLWLTNEVGGCQREVFSTCRDVHSGLVCVEREPLGRRQVLLADTERIARMVCGSEPGERETRARGYFVCEDVGLEHAIGADEETLSLRSERIYEGVEDLYAWFPILDNEDLVERCRALLSQEPVCSEDTSLSVVIDIQERRVDCAVDGGQWRTVWLKSQ